MKNILPRIYVGCNLTHSPESFKEDVKALKNILRKNGKYEILDFLGQGLEYTPQQVFEYDISCVRRCDVFIANATFPGLGVGAEFGVAVERKKPIITIAEKDAIVSRFIFGYTDPHHFVYRYNSIEDAAKYISQKLEELFPTSTVAIK